jgi:hypothetical protein
LTSLIEAAWYALLRHIDLWRRSTRTSIRTWRLALRLRGGGGVAFLVVALARSSPPPRRSAGAIGGPLRAFAARLTAPIRRDEIQQRNWVCRTGAAVVTAAVVTAAVVTAVVAAGVRMPARVETAACVKTAAGAGSAATAMAATTPREHGRSSDRNNHGDRCN